MLARERSDKNENKKDYLREAGKPGAALKLAFRSRVPTPCRRTQRTGSPEPANERETQTESDGARCSRKYCSTFADLRNVTTVENSPLKISPLLAFHSFYCSHSRAAPSAFNSVAPFIHTINPSRYQSRQIISQFSVGVCT